ncbi:MAG: phosphate starvation-inducible protein PsiF [Gammaproteobacteria bacterium]|nr:phosphate starvation-inducible protein PsiF [Gammaproteobacteria bacterium]
MKVSKWLVAIGATLAIGAGQEVLAQAAATSPDLNSQQQKMKECNADAKAKGVKGDERKSFMSSCLSAKGMSQEQINKQQEKMKTCNADAKSKGLKGADYKAFIKTCLSGSG